MSSLQLEDYISCYFSSKGFSNSSINKGDRAIFVVSPEQGEDRIVIIDQDFISERFIFSVVIVHEQAINKDIVFSLLEWNYDCNDYLPGSFAYDKFSKAIVLKAAISSVLLTEERFSIFLDRLISHAYKRIEQLNKVNSRKNNLVSSAPINSMLKRRLNFA